VPNLGTTEILIIAVVVMVLFGAKRLPDASRSLGRSLRIFKAETKGLREDGTSESDAALPPVIADKNRQSDQSNP
jgi:sec-independent protein translocase protein TatA